ncbi:hypothetical protein [Sporolactobacillus terrae]|uniref:Uncharacterized protein n=1 Tax=Sporolactobacillus terrae TaxID=269673 RepID=A0A5K7WV03_9BACL|nr:hypothetical protein [Sporolactobacillus terrae]BBN97519.1 hypothetical protein St703_02240 [Sporolactobacillus terrae]
MKEEKDMILPKEIGDAAPDITLEHKFVNVPDKLENIYHHEIIKRYGISRCMKNGYAQRTNHEIYSGLKRVANKRINLDAEIVNLPFTVLDLRGNPANTAFTDRYDQRIFLVPDYTPVRIVSDKAFHKTGYDELLKEKKITKEQHDYFVSNMEKMDVGERVSSSIIHEYGHILTYRALDRESVDNAKRVFEFLHDYKYLDNCSKRIVQFSESSVPWKINAAIEQLAEDYRVSHDIRDSFSCAQLPHCITFKQDIENPDYFLEGVEIMAKLLNVSKKKVKRNETSDRNYLDSIMPFGEASRTPKLSQFMHGNPTPMTEEDYQRDLKFFENDD